MNKLRILKIFIGLLLVLGLLSCNKEKKQEKKEKTALPLIQNVKLIESKSDIKREISSPINLFRDKTKKAWLLKNNINPVGAYFELSFDKEMFIDKLVFQQVQGVNKIQELLVHFENPYQKKKQKFILEHDEKLQVFPLDNAISANKITVTILKMTNEKIRLKTGLALFQLFYKKEPIRVSILEKIEKKEDQIPEEKKTVNKDLLIKLGIKAVSSSSTKSSGTKKYHPQKIIDGNPKTLWIEGQNKEGIKEFIQFDLKKKEAQPNQISIVTSTSETPLLYNRIKEFSIEFGFSTNRGFQYLPVQQFTAKDKPGEQFFNLNYNKKLIKGKIKTVFVTLTIHSVFFGKNSKDTGLYEVTFYKERD